jgi:hypothetical protein
MKRYKLRLQKDQIDMMLDILIQQERNATLQANTIKKHGMKAGRSWDMRFENYAKELYQLRMAIIKGAELEAEVNKPNWIDKTIGKIKALFTNNNLR